MRIYGAVEQKTPSEEEWQAQQYETSENPHRPHAQGCAQGMAQLSMPSSRHQSQPPKQQQQAEQHLRSGK